MSKALMSPAPEPVPPEVRAPDFDPASMIGLPGMEGFGNADVLAALAAEGIQPRPAVAGTGALPHADTLEASFGRDLSGVGATVGGAAADANAAMGSEALQTGSDVAFADTPDLWEAAHETAHALDPKEPAGGLSAASSDPAEKHADAIADKVVAGESVAAEVGDGPVPDKAGVSLYTKERAKGNMSKVGAGKEVIKPDAYSQDLYATDKRVNEANSKLASAGKDGSFITLKTEDGFDYGGKTLNRVVPEFITGGSKERDGQHAGLLDPNQGGEDTEGVSDDSLALWSDCGRSSAAVTGSQGGDREAVYNDNGVEKTTQGKHDKSVSGWLRTEPGGMANDIYSTLIPKFIRQEENFEFLKEGVHYTIQREYEGKVRWFRKRVGLDVDTPIFKDPANIVDAKRFYAAMTPKGQDKFDREAGINHYANPDIGDTYTMATEGDMPGFKQKKGANVWNYHWGGVIMKDGSDNITLENYAVTGEYAKSKGVSSRDFVNREWNFEMYGTEDKDQTFHNDHLDSGTHGSKATTMRVQTQK